jgi:hypothetical protein
MLLQSGSPPRNGPHTYKVDTCMHDICPGPDTHGVTTWLDQLRYVMPICGPLVANVGLTWMHHQSLAHMHIMSMLKSD